MSQSPQRVLLPSNHQSSVPSHISDPSQKSAIIFIIRMVTLIGYLEMSA